MLTNSKILCQVDDACDASIVHERWFWAPRRSKSRITVLRVYVLALQCVAIKSAFLTKVVIVIYVVSVKCFLQLEVAQEP